MKYNLSTKALTLSADLETPVGIYLKIRDIYPQSALLESSDYHTAHNSVSYIGVNPIARFTVKDETIHCYYPNGILEENKISEGADVVKAFSSFIKSFSLDKTHEGNGFFGFTSYDAVRYFEKINITKKETDFNDIPDMQYMLYRFIITVNHYRNQMTIIENIPDGAISETQQILDIIRNNNFAQYPFIAKGESSSTLTDNEYKEIVSKCVGHAMRGDVFQIVPSRRFCREFEGDEFNVYRALRSINPSPYLFYFDFGTFKIFGSSPETHLKVQNGRAYIDPIAGTFRRTGDDAKDHELAEALLSDPKENSEHIMLVDLARNDLSRSGGKVQIDFLKQIQYYSHVIHMVSRVSCALKAGTDAIKLFSQTFPAGTLSGAPKVRAMQIIDQLEPHSRMAYGGCIGFIGFNNELNQAITIRSFMSYHNKLYSQAGAGIVALSNPENELQEIKNKLGALDKAIDYAESFTKQTIS